ncbi:MAG: glycosyltransferase family 2 protein [Mediterraneibacter faecis]
MTENDKNLISVIIPLYNAEKYLKNCITSVVGQTYRNLEIILVDDGSNDNSLSICEKFALQDNRIKVFHQNNGGVASARNKGLSEASGEFIAWVDSDDSIEPEYIEKLYDAVKEYNADISIALKQYKKQIKYIHSREKIVQEYLMGNLTAYLWSTLVKRALYNELRFEQLKIGEDALMLCRLYCRAENLLYFKAMDIIISKELIRHRLKDLFPF